MGELPDGADERGAVEAADDARAVGRKARPPRPALLAAAIALLAVLPFAVALGGPWIWDDHALVECNSWAHSFSHWTRWFTHDFWDLDEEARTFSRLMIYWRPLVTFSYAVDWKLGGGEPFVFHLTNLLSEGLVGLLAFRALHRWIGRPIPALVAAALFVLHPTKAESVAWIAGRTDVLCAAFVLLACEGWAMRARGSSPRARGAGFAVEALATLLAYTTKEQAIVIPAFIAVEAWAALGRPAIELPVARKLARAGLPQLGLAAAYLLLRRRFLPFIVAGAIGAADRAKMVLESFGHYARSTFWPRELSVQQGLVHSHHGRLVFHASYMAAGALFLATLAALSLAARRRAPGVTVGLALFFASILPTSNVVPTAMMTLVSDRFLYLPMIGLAFALVAAIELLAERPRRLATVAAGACALVLGVASVARADDFTDDAAFWARERRLHPDSLEAIRVEISRAERAHDFRKALALAAEGQRVAAASYSHVGDEADFIIFGARFLALTTPDREADRLRAIARFCDEAADARAQTASLTLSDVSITVPVDRGSVGKRIRLQRPLLLALDASILSSLGDDQRELALAEEAQRACATCGSIGAALALVAARAGDYARAERALDAISARQGAPAAREAGELVQKAQLLAKQAALAPEGPLRLNLRAKELSTLNAWGRAYAVLAPYERQIRLAPGMAFGFAELAFRAGYADVAGEVLAALVPPEKIAPIEHAWAQKMGWVAPDPGPQAEGASP